MLLLLILVVIVICMIPVCRQLAHGFHSHTPCSRVLLFLSESIKNDVGMIVK